MAFGKKSFLAAPLWVAFAWFYFAAVTRVAAQSFFVAVRGTGVVGYPSWLVIVSRSLDSVILVGLGVMMLAVHSFLSARSAGASPLLVSGVMAVSLVGYAFVSPLFVILLGPTALAIFLQDNSVMRPKQGSTKETPAALLLFGLVGSLAAVAVMGTAWWVAAGFNGALPFGQGWALAFAGLRILGVSYPWLPWIVLVFLFSWALRPLLGSRVRLATWPREEDLESGPQSELHRLPWPRIAVLAALAIAAFVGLYPYLPAVNPARALVGTDVTGGYSCWLGLTPNPVMTWECNASWYIPHIGSLWLLQGITALTGSAKLTLQLYPVWAGLLFVLSTWLLAREGTNDSTVAALSALFASVSLQTATAIDAGILANWVALSVGFLFFAAFLRALRTRSFRLLFPASTLTVLILFIHPWTWFLLLGILVAYLLVELVQAKLSHTLLQRRIEVTMLSIKISLGVIAGEAKSLLTLGTGSAPIITNTTAPVMTNGFAPGVTTVLGALKLANIPQTVPFLASSMIEWLGGAEVDPLWFILAALGVLAIPSFKGRFGKLMIVWVACIGISLLVTGSPSSLLQERLIFDIPIPILAAIGFTRATQFFTSRLPDGSLSLRKPSGIFWLLSLVSVMGLALGFTLEYVGLLFIP